MFTNMETLILISIISFVSCLRWVKITIDREEEDKYERRKRKAREEALNSAIFDKRWCAPKRAQFSIKDSNGRWLTRYYCEHRGQWRTAAQR